ncbi:Rieske (2Fe-2S) protein [Nocardioides sp. HDW12B]|uniref:Rieske (2Fe-2S) protein n=1 Tax=Nocardioides sp. HDW12B TaxID=2714939 RepID=UPI0014090C84|nr:Rieske (2Fe-2S) protein [Nocardioides sp. HDW12B]QIK66327.1 Rieske (2Fe-2S) protein [Nocardioides sp. HDW12B]
MADLVPLRDLPLDRRRLIGCAALFGVSGPLLAACSSGSSSEDSEDSEDAAASTSAGAALVAAADVPVGGGVVLSDLNIVVTQPKKGEFRAFDSRCTHQNGTLSEPQDGIMTCPLHGSQFSVEGENLVGPNGEPAGSTPDLDTVDVEVQGGDVVRA